jgi:histidinol-phosphate/aromatic aminotransferase/cobyric acid decarboxylase-like protein
VLAELQRHLDWIARTSPPTQCEGLVNAVSETRGVPAECIVPGAGSSDLIFRAMLHWLKPGARVLLLDPTYGEYRHVFQHVVPCQVDYVSTSIDEGFAIDLDRLSAGLRQCFDMVVLVNPNNPTGAHISRDDLERVLRSAPKTTRFWIDEAYIDYISSDESLERFAAGSSNVIVCKSLSKAYALSGLRVGYLCGPRELMSELRSITPPWVVGLAAQVAAVHALRDREYYQTRYAETRELRSALAADLEASGLAVWLGAANFLLCRLPPSIGPLAAFLTRCREQGLFLRDIASMTSRPESHSGMFRVAVKDVETNRRMVAIIRDNLV